MTGSTGTTSTGYRRGDEVVARLGGIEVHSVEGGGTLSRACVPPWTIALVEARARRASRDAYLLRFDHDGCACIAWVPGELIEGLA